MQYDRVIPAIFLERPNRFIALVQIGSETERVHVKNTGRCRELLVPGCTVYLAAGNNPKRKTQYDLIAVEKERPGQNPLRINMDSQIPNAAAAEWLPKSGLFSPEAEIRREVTYGNSRFDFGIQDNGRQAFLEVKGVTLEQDGIVSFPDAPTQRGVKHLRELVQYQLSGHPAYLLFVVQMKGAVCLRPNDAIDSDFGEALRIADAAGVTILARDCIVTPDSMTLDAPVPINLS